MCSSAGPLFPWREAYSVHIPQIDGQHQELIGMINQLHDAMRQSNGNAILGSLLDDLVGYAQSHFAFEEAMLEQRGYRGLLAHRAEHQKLTQQVVELQEKFRAGKLVMTVQVMQFLKDWLANHILECDRRYAQ